MPRKKQSKFTRCQKLATERNWCIYVWRGMIGLLVVFRRFGVSKAAVDKLEMALNSFYWSIDMTYQIQKDKVLAEDDEETPRGKVVSINRRKQTEKRLSA